MRSKLDQFIARVSALIVIFTLSLADSSFARMGGAGGHGGHSSGGGYGYGGGGGGGFYIGGGGGGGLSTIVIIIIVIVIVMAMKNAKGKPGAITDEGEAVPSPAQPFPQGLNPQKVGTAFLAMQNAWMQKDMKNVRKWLSDGMYQRLHTQFKMMNALGQSNNLSNIHIYGIECVGTAVDGNYQTAEVAISFSMNDSFVSSKYPQFNESYPEDTDTEYWTFIKRTDSPAEKNLYDNNNCPNCGAPFEVKMGEIARCSNCNTLTNSAAYDWVLCEITQESDFSGGAGLSDDTNLSALMAGDPFFSVQRMEDIASNIFMQVMEVFSMDDRKRLTRFADDATTDAIMAQKQKMQPFIFDRLFLNSVDLNSYDVAGDTVNLRFRLSATYRRVATDGRLHMIDPDFVTHQFTMQLSRNKDVFKDPKAGETVYSYECSSCGAPYNDTTEDTCTYCGAPVIDKTKNWVLTGFS